MQNEEVLVTFLHSSFLFYGCTNREFHLQNEEVTFNQHPDLFEAKETITCFQGKYPTSLVFFVTSRQIGALNLGALSPSTLRMNQMASKHQPFPNVLDNNLYNTLNPNLSINPAYLPGKKKWRSSARYMWIGVEGSLAIPRKPPLNPSFSPFIHAILPSFQNPSGVDWQQLLASSMKGYNGCDCWKI